MTDIRQIRELLLQCYELFPEARTHCEKYLPYKDLYEYNSYDEEVSRTIPEGQLEHYLPSFGMGVSGEAGEVSDLLKKYLYHGHDKPHKSRIGNELGDVLWYLVAIGKHFDLTLDDLIALNTEKLRLRYPNGFNEDLYTLNTLQPYFAYV